MWSCDRTSCGPHNPVADERDLRAAIDALAQRIQTLHLLAAEIRRDTARSAERAIELEGQIDQCVAILRRLQPKGER